MSEFKTSLDVRWKGEDDDGVPCWELLSELVYSSDLLGRDVCVPDGFVTDFASVPRIPLAYLMAGNTGHRAAVIHDYLLHSKEIERIRADDVFYEALIASGVNPWRASAMAIAVKSQTTALDHPPEPYDPSSHNA